MEELNIVAKDENLDLVLNTIKKYLEDYNTPQKLVIPVMVAVEEIYINIAHYAYGDGQGMARVEMEISPDPKRIVVTFRDKGVPYNPLEKEDPDITLGAAERPIGGLGIFMTKEMMDEMSYKYEDGENVLTIIKNL